jgi:calcineurin-like phosphoesterase family protein
MLNLRDTDQQKVYVSSDFHLGHQRDFVWKSRGYNSVQEHDDGLINILNETVRPNDILLFLGDFCLNTTVDQFNSYLDRIKCQNIMALWGNHNNPHEKSIYKKVVGDKEQYPVKYKNITYLGHYVEVILNGQFVVLFHYPIFIWNEQKNGSWCLCGHSHNSFPQTRADNLYGKILDVGWDGHSKPWSFSEISAVMNGKRFIPLDHHQ